MQSLASAARLLGRCVSAAHTSSLLSELGFVDPPVPLTPEGADILALPPQASEVMIARGCGALRALVFEVHEESDTRSLLGRVAGRLSSRAPQLLWLLAAIDRHRGEIGLATFDSAELRPRVAALVARRHAIVDSDSETVCALAAAVNESDVQTHLRWLDILGRDSVSRRFFRELQRMVRALADSLEPSVNPSDAMELALLYVSRLLFLSFLETKGWLDRDHGFLGNRYADCMVSGGGYHRRVLKPLFFGTLNTHPQMRAARAREFGRVPFLNGGLFSRAPLEARTSTSLFSDEALGDLFADLLTRYRFTAREDATSWSEAAIDPEMLGKAFESLMSSSDRKTSGAFYTPQSLVREVSRAALTWGLASPRVPHETVARALAGEIPCALHRTGLLDAIHTARILDPACGSGAFIVHILEELAGLRVRLGDLRPPHVIRREILTRSIFGVDINPTAVWLCELRLWLSMAIEDPEPDPMRVVPLPNLDRNIRVGDSLAGEAFRDMVPRISGGRIASVRARYARATGPRKRSLAKALDNMERECAIATCETRIIALRHDRREIIAAARSRDLFGERRPPSADIADRLARIRDDLRTTARYARSLADGAALPFSFSTRFADVASRGGFDVIVGNPPWIRTHNLDPRVRRALKQRYSVYRNAAWLGGSEAAAAGKGFGSQVDVAALFIERCIDLMRESATCALIVPTKLWRSLAGGGVRALLSASTEIREIHDLTSAHRVFDAAVYPSILVASRCITPANGEATVDASLTASAHHDGHSASWMIRRGGLPFDDSSGSPWLIVPPEVRASFDALGGAGIPLSRSHIGRPLLGVKTGCNDAFLVLASGEASVDPDVALIRRGSIEAPIEAGMLRPAVRGESVGRWSIGRSSELIVWTHDATGNPMRRLPANAMRWLSSWRRELEQRSDARGKTRWWSLFRTDSAEFDFPRVVWSDIGKSPRAAVIPAGNRSVPLNTCYVVRCRDMSDACTLAALLNSTLVAGWLAAIAEPARGGFRRYLGWTMSLLPIPRDWDRARCILGPLGKRAIEGTEPSEEELLAATLASYRLSVADVDPLLEWSR